MAAAAQVVANGQSELGGDLPDIGRGVSAMENAAEFEVGTPDCPDRVVELLGTAPLPTDPAGRELLHALQAAAPLLQWSDPYSDRDDLMDLRAGYFVTTLVGGPTRSAALTFGEDASVFLTVQAPHLLYPAHDHLAPELYYAIAGTADWQKGDEPFAPQPPGSWIVHPPWTSHAMQTREEPLVALAVWTADLDSVAVIH